MKVILAKNSGFCMGVRRAVETAKKIYGQGVYILGEIIHNESVTDEIKRLGTKIIDSPDEVDNGTVIIRSHGVGKDVYDKLEAKGIKNNRLHVSFCIENSQYSKEIPRGRLQDNHYRRKGSSGGCGDKRLVR